MKFTKTDSELYMPCAANLGDTTDLCLAAHHDDIELMAYSTIARCYAGEGRFSGVVVSDGAGSPRTGLYEGYSDSEMKAVRIREQKHAAQIGNYLSLALLGFESSEIKLGSKAVVNDIKKVILEAAPENVYTHNLADKHDTHVAVCLRVIEALRDIPTHKRPKKLYGMEVWRGLDWLRDEDKAIFDTSARPSLAAALLGVFDSQISGGKRYDLAASGRRCANATFFESHNTDKTDSLSFGIDMTALIDNDSIDPEEFILSLIRNFSDDVESRIKRAKAIDTLCN